ncbi:MAG TPA: alkaline shock response membrane anchor protein AmaP [Anaerolineae bacterium]|jgi:uncharacterized alkaline shock family protein YloU
MNLINRFLVIVELLIAIALAPILIVVLVFLRGSIVDTVDNFSRGLVSGPNALVIQASCIGLVAFVFVVAILLLFLELQRPSIHRLHVQSVTEGQVEVTADAIMHRLEHAILQIADVTRVKPRVISASKGNSVDLAIELETSPEVNVPKKTQEVIAAAKQVLEEQMGLQVGKIQVQVNHAQVKK